MGRGGTTGSRDRLVTIAARSRSVLTDDDARAKLDGLFAAGHRPGALPDGFFSGRFVALNLVEPLAGAARLATDLYMPWIGKTFEASAARGINVLTPAARPVMRLLWPTYTPERELADRLEAFSFEIRMGRGTLDPQLEVLKLDYDRDANPALLVRNVLDELVEIDENLLLGKFLMRWGSSFRPMGFFSLDSAVR